MSILGSFDWVIHKVPKMSEQTHYDIIIAGSGAGGGTLAYALASTGLKILILERGGYLPREKENWDSSSLFINKT